MSTLTHPAPAFDPFGAAFLADPFPTFAHYRHLAPVFYSAALDYWILARYSDIRNALRDTTTYSASNALSPINKPAPEAAAILREGYRSVPTLTNADPPAHTRARKLANIAFTPRMVARMEDYIRDLAVHFIEERVHGPEVDIVSALTWELPALVIFKILGVPDLDVPRVKAWGGNRLLLMFGRIDESEQTDVAEGMVAFWRYTEDLIRDRAAHPRDDFTSEFVHATDANGQRLEPNQVATILFGLLLAGHETTTHLLSSAIRRFLEHRATAWEPVCHDPSLLPNAVEEVLRFDPPINIWRRRTKQRVRVQDVDMPADANLMLLIGSANRDESVFAAPEVFDIHRSNARDHLSFGMGNHLCLGAPLARLEARVVLEELTRRRPGLHLVDKQTLAFHPNISLRGPSALRVALG
jgi:cytochrome P450